MIMTNTKGKGVDLVLNSLTGKLFQASVRCLAQRGRFLEIGKMESFNRTQMDANMFLKNISFHGVHVDDLFDIRSKYKVKYQIQKLLAEGNFLLEFFIS